MSVGSALFVAFAMIVLAMVANWTVMLVMQLDGLVDWHSLTRLILSSMAIRWKNFADSVN